ncbi:MAG: putative PhoU family protein [Nitrososphaeraceae archaeon]|jgi:phosphate uptake regulator|nr:putative PhoU family protein [Nitrososphaeraceae archaeon]MCD6036369.1 putative PhoU family protein [Nitrososphaeraceae archaeon]MDF2767717.1 putative PhoU family protein [Nitrososphaeraceae archaeon]
MSRYARRLQKIGSSMLLSLPSEWVKNNNLKKGNMVMIEVNRNNSISLYPSDIDAEDVKEVNIPHPQLSMDSLTNQIYGAYLLGYNIIRIKGKSQISFDDRELIKLAMRKLVGLEIVDENGSNIISQFLLDANTLDAEKILRRMSSIVAGMYKDTLLGIRKKENGSEKSIVSRDDEVDRQYFLLVRLIRSAMMDQKLASKLNLSNIDILDYRIAANHLESAGDYITDFAAALPIISHDNLIEEIIQAASLIEKMQEKSIAGFINKNRDESNEVIKIYSKFNGLLNLTKELSAQTDIDKKDAPIALLNSIFSMDKIARCWVDIADLVKPVYLTAALRNA